MDLDLDLEKQLDILLRLDDPSKLLRFSCASPSHQRFVVENGVFKQQCLRMFPQLSDVVLVTECMDKDKPNDAAGSSKRLKSTTLEKEHRVYSYFYRCIKSIPIGDLIHSTLCASSTKTHDPYMALTIDHTLLARNSFGSLTSSHWLSTGQYDASVPEMLTYKLINPLCVVTEINIKPFQDYSASAVRFRLGYANPDSNGTVDKLGRNLPDDLFVWNYTTPQFRMTQENRLQKFKLPKPVLCIGGVVQIELLGRVKRQLNDGLFYMGVSHVQILGQSLLSRFGVDIVKNSKSFVLNALDYDLPIGLKNDLLRVGKEFGRIGNIFPFPSTEDMLEDMLMEEDYDADLHSSLLSLTRLRSTVITSSSLLPIPIPLLLRPLYSSSVSSTNRIHRRPFVVVAANHCTVTTNSASPSELMYNRSLQEEAIELQRIMPMKNLQIYYHHSNGVNNNRFDKRVGSSAHDREVVRVVISVYVPSCSASETMEKGKLKTTTLSDLRLGNIDRKM
ncbi:hypothetical protein ACFE04_026722 [Oxalis oulophora]